MELTFDGGVDKHGSKAGRHEVQESGLTVLKDKHDNDSSDDGKDVANDSSMEERTVSNNGCFYQLFESALSGDHIDLSNIERSEDVVTKAHSHEDAWDDDITESKKGELGRLSGPVSWEENLDRSINALGNGEHDIGAEDEEDVVEEKAN